MIAPKPAMAQGVLAPGGSASTSAASPPHGGAVAPTPAKVPLRPQTLTQPPPLPVEDDWESEPTRVGVIKDDATAAVAAAPEARVPLAGPIAPA
ncbi:MAG: hypothetical protein M3O36_11000, partial [Myxococcota bacterium]|nr:hypothetical protein [Myxococcota bacterium]